MNNSDLLVEGFYAHYACQFVICAFIGLLLGKLSAWNEQALMKWWALSWMALAGYIACAGNGLALVVNRFPADGLVRISLGWASIFFALVQPWALVRGWIEERSGRSAFAMKFAQEKCESKGARPCSGKGVAPCGLR